MATSRSDPTRTKTTRRRYAQKLRGRFAEINTEIRAGVADRDVFGLSESDTGTDILGGEALADPLPNTFPRRTDQQIETFDEWLKRQQRDEVLDVISRNGNTYVKSGYKRGLKHAEARLREQGVDVPSEDIEELFNRGIHRDTLEILYTSDYSDLEGITAEVSKQSNRVLTEGFAQGYNPNKMARELTDRVDKIGKTRATTLARTSVIDAHAQATLNRYEELGTDTVTIKAEWSTAGDNRVCPICQTLEGRVMTIQEARTETFRYSAGADEPSSLSGEYPIKPPAHPRCRCSILPVIN